MGLLVLCVAVQGLQLRGLGTRGVSAASERLINVSEHKPPHLNAELPYRPPSPERPSATFRDAALLRFLTQRAVVEGKVDAKAAQKFDDALVNAAEEGA